MSCEIAQRIPYSDWKFDVSFHQNTASRRKAPPKTMRESRPDEITDRVDFPGSGADHSWPSCAIQPLSGAIELREQLNGENKYMNFIPLYRVLKSFVIGKYGRRPPVGQEIEISAASHLRGGKMS